MHTRDELIWIFRSSRYIYNTLSCLEAVSLQKKLLIKTDIKIENVIFFVIFFQVQHHCSKNYLHWYFCWTMLEFLSLKQCKDYIANFTSSQSGSVQKERDFNFFLEFKDMNHNQISFNKSQNYNSMVFYPLTTHELTEKRRCHQINEFISRLH